MKDYQSIQKKYVVDTYVNRQLTLTRGEGAFLFDENGAQYLDLMTNYGVNIFGYGHPAITKALVDQLQNLPTLHGSFVNDVRAEASEELIKRCGQHLAQVYWSNSGAEAIEAALKFAVLTKNKKRFIACDHGYHGKTLGALSATAGEKYKKPFEPLLWEFVHIPFNDAAALEASIDTNTAAFIVESIQGEGGIHVPNPEYLKKVREACMRHNVLLIIDEIQTGIGRTGTFLRSEKDKVYGDILCLGKGLAGGIPVGATLVSEEVAHAIPKHIHTSTFGGNPLALRGVLVTLSELDNTTMNHIKNIGRYFKEQLKKVQSAWITEVRGEGLMLGVVIKEKRNQLLKLLQEDRVLAIPSGEDVVRFLPPYILRKANVDQAISALTKSQDMLS